MESSRAHNVTAVRSTRSGFTFPHPAPGPEQGIASAPLVQFFDRQVQVGAEQAEVGKTRRFFGAVHQDVGLCSCWRIGDQIDFHSAGVSEDRDGFRADRPMS